MLKWIKGNINKIIIGIIVFVVGSLFVNTITDLFPKVNSFCKVIFLESVKHLGSNTEVSNWLLYILIIVSLFLLLHCF